MESPNIRSLLVFKSLRIYAPQIEAKRVKASYEVTHLNGEIATNELIYSYSEKVFEPESVKSINLASMMLCQVALNYGLFCKEIVFEGLFDDTDKRFILDMLENTSREIYVNKFLLPNEFLINPYNKLQPEKLKTYTAAVVSFINTNYQKIDNKWVHSNVDSQKFIVLSSGGKDSLLSYGLLKELKMEVYPVFINESGRHWFTAINAFKFFEENEKNTSRVWCNSDRIFNWMLRQMPFIREDFVNVRADIYPVRLWTVAVFLFGVLPIAHKENAGNIIIGDEYDTTMKTTFHGITHYQALYDQSRYFDKALTRYYIKKGWNAYQYSLLRSMSEMLILKTLVKRYPYLQEHQISCHAAHKKDDRIYPCGKCEKCRRIVAMMLVLGENPARCGYTQEQIDFALSSLENKGVKQIGSDAAHLFHLLVKNELIAKDSKNASMGKAFPNIMKLRFDKERSTPNDIPFLLRKKLLPIYLEYADGSVSMLKKKWINIDVLSNGLFNQSFPFELEGGQINTDRLKKEYAWELHTWTELEEKLKHLDTAILPCGSIEQHGPHLPVDVDYFDSKYLANRVADACSYPKPLVLPAIPYGVAYHHEDFKGTVSVSNNTLSAFVYDIGMSLAKNGINKLIILNGHGDNSPTLLYAAQMINRDSGIFVCVETGETSDSDIYKLIDTPNDIHAGEIETSTTMAIRPELVQIEKAINETLNFGSTYLDFTSDRGVAWYVRTNIISKSGIMGNPLLASSEKGKKIWEIMIAQLVKFIEEVKKSKLEDLFQRRY